ncbi:hypothetical protein TW91_1929 [Neisseria flavescens]|nr:hypothetical protein TW91_1929 [Neisseria flavescens]
MHQKISVKNKSLSCFTLSSKSRLKNPFPVFRRPLRPSSSL